MEKQRGEESEKRREEKNKEDQRRERVRRKKMQVREKVEKLRNAVFFQRFGAQEGRKVGSLKRRAEPSGGMKDEKVHAIVARSTFTSQNAQSTPGPDHFWKLRCGKSARRCGTQSTFRSQNVQNTPCSEHFWKLRCWKAHASVVRSTFPGQNV